MSEQYLSLEQAAARLGTDTKELLLLAAASEIPIAVDADSWIAVEASERESGHIDRKPETQQILNSVWLYMRAGYMRRFLSLRPDEAIQAGGKFRSRPDGPVDTWVEPKPFIRVGDLHVRALDIEQRLQNSARVDAKESGSDRYAAWQRLAEEYAAEWAAKNPGRIATKAKAAQHVGRKLGVNAATVERKINPTWRKPRQKGSFA